VTSIFNRSIRPGVYFARFYYVDPKEEGPDDEIVEELCNDGEAISLREAVTRAKTLEDRHPDSYAYEVVERQGIHWDCGWEWRGVTRWEVGEELP
jgi:hypothetical protein